MRPGIQNETTPRARPQVYVRQVCCDQSGSHCRRYMSVVTITVTNPSRCMLFVRGLELHIK